MKPINHIFVQARMGSTRLPGKVLKKILGKSVIELMIERLRHVEKIDEIIIVTGSQTKNEELISEIKKIGLTYFCGCEENILDRFYQAGIEFKSDNIIRVTADCPLIDFNLINNAISLFLEKDVDILSINKPRTFPHGLDFEIFKKDSLASSWRENRKNYSNEEEFHNSFISPAVYMLEQKKFKHYNILNNSNLSHIRLTLDYPEDFELITKIYEFIYPRNKNFGLKEILEFLNNNPALLEINKKYVQSN